MATKTKTTTKTVTKTAPEGEETMTLAEVRALLAKEREEGRKEGAKLAREERKRAREEREERRSKPGYHSVTLTDTDARYNVLARCEYIVPDVAIVTGSACMVEHDGERVARFVVAPNPVFGVPGVSATSEEELIAILSATLDAAPEILAGLREEYDSNAEGHTFLPPAKRKEEDRKAKAKAKA